MAENQLKEQQNQENPLDHTLDVLSFDLQDTEGLNRIINNLEKVQKSFGNVSGTIEDRVVQQQKKISEMVERIKMCKRKILALNNLQVAMKFESPAKFPKKYNFVDENRESVYSNVTKPKWHEVLQTNEFQPKIVLGKDQQKGKYPQNHRDELPQIVQMIYSKFKPRRKNIFEGQNAITKNIKEQHQTMGEVPRNLKFADNLLIFNTKVNPYKHYQPIDNLKIHKKEKNLEQRNKQNNNDQIELFEAPKTITENDRHAQKTADSNFYIPEYKAVVQLQDDGGLQGFLDGVVQMDINQDDNSEFIPSKGGVIKKQAVQDPNLPQQQQNTQLQQQPLQQLQQGYNNNTNQQNQQQQQPQQQQPIQNTSIPQPPPLLNNNTPQPPPINQIQQPPTIALPTTQQPPMQVQAPKAAAPAGGGGINDLLDEIRNPRVVLRKRVTKEKGGVGIKVGQKKEDDQDNNDNPKPKSGGGMSIMEQLQAQVKRRYDALHAKKEQEQTKAKQKIGSDSENDDDDDDDEDDEDED